MALQGTVPDARRSTGSRTAVVEPEIARARSFARARRHTVLVRFLRLALPAVALLTLATYGAGVGFSVSTPTGKIDTGSIAVSTQSLTMSNPRYEGFNKDGSKFNVTAKTAVQDIRQEGPIELNVIDGRLVQANNSAVKLTAPRGLFNHKENKLDLFDDIKIRGDDGLRADLTQATILMKENRIISKQPVAIDMAAGQVRANEMELLQSSKQVTFSNGVVTRLRPEPKPPAAAARQASLPGQRVLGGSDAPVDIASQKLVVDDVKKIAIFTGNVVAKQGEATLSGPELQAFYEGAPIGKPAANPSPPQPADGPPAGGKLKRLFVPANVTMTQGADRVTSDSADFDAIQETATLIGRVVINSGPERQATSDRADLDSHNDTALLSGNVVVTQDKNVLKGTRLYIDRRGGNTKLSTPASADQPAGRISARFFQGGPAKPAATAAAAVKKAVPATDGFVFRTDPNAPIDIDSETLDVLDRTKTATFRGAVHAVQGEFTIRTPELIATYSGEAGLGASSDSKQPPAQLTRVRANQKVEVTSANDQSATGDWADMDVKANTVTLGGHVVMKKGSSIVYAPKAIIDMTTGITVLEPETHAGPAVSASPTEQRAPYALPDLPAKKAAVVPPKAPAFDTDPAACPPGRMCLKIDPKDSAAIQPGSKQGAAKDKGKSWQTETAPPKAKAPAASTSGWTWSQPSAN